LSTSPLHESKFRILFAGSWVLWIALQATVLHRYQFSLGAAIVDSLVSNLLLALVCILIAHTLNFYLPTKERYGYILALITILTIVWIVTSRLLLMLFVDHRDYENFFTQSLPIRVAVGFLVAGSMALLSVLWYTLQDQRENEKRRTEAEKLSKESELYKLRQQLQPHFLFNSLNSINALIGLKPQEARLMVQQLSDFLRGTLKKEENSWVSLEEELQHLQLYLEIEKVRFGHRLSTEIINDEHCNKCQIPAMLLQPIVENAIKFGLYDTIEDITISIQTELIDDILVISVKNPFDLETNLPKQGTGFGLSSIQRRLYLLFARNDLLQTATKGNIFITTIKIPQPNDKGNNNR
jgi:two-component system, LytTR family, sensor kinase